MTIFVWRHVACDYADCMNQHVGDDPDTNTEARKQAKRSGWVRVRVDGAFQDRCRTHDPRRTTTVGAAA